MSLNSRRIWPSTLTSGSINGRSPALPRLTWQLPPGAMLPGFGGLKLPRRLSWWQICLSSFLRSWSQVDSPRQGNWTFRARGSLSFNQHQSCPLSLCSVYSGHRACISSLVLTRPLPSSSSVHILPAPPPAAAGDDARRLARFQHPNPAAPVERSYQLSPFDKKRMKAKSGQEQSPCWADVSDLVILFNTKLSEPELFF